MDTFLPPIEKPKGLMMELAYYFNSDRLCDISRKKNSGGAA